MIWAVADKHQGSIEDTPMINLQTDTTLSLLQAAKLIPPTRGDKPVQVCTLVRWILHGVRGVRLEAVRIGGRWITSHEALDRFTAALTAQYNLEPTQTTSTSKPELKRYQRHQECVEEQLAALGI